MSFNPTCSLHYKLSKNMFCYWISCFVWPLEGVKVWACQKKNEIYRN